MDPNSPGYTNALLEDINDKFQIVLEATQPIPDLQEKVGSIQEQLVSTQEQVGSMQIELGSTKEQVGSMQEQVGSMQEQVGSMQEQIGKIMEWESDIKLIPTIFDEVGKLRLDVEATKVAVHEVHQRLDVVEQAVKLIERNTSEIDELRNRITALEKALESK